MAIHPVTPPQNIQKNKHNNKEKIRGILIGSLSICFILLQFVSEIHIENIVSFVILITIIWCLPGIRGTTLYISLFLLITGLFLMLYHQAPLMEWVTSLRINLTIVAIFIVVPLLSIPVRTGGYVDALKIVLSQKMNQPYFFYIGTNILTHLLSVVINIGSISIVTELAKASKIEHPKLRANAINRGYIMAVFWSPYFSSMALILAFLPIEWSSIFLYSLGFVLIAILVSIILDWKEIKRSAPPKEESIYTEADESDVRVAKRKLVELITYISLITGAVLFLEYITPASMVLMVSLVSLTFPLVWCLFSKKGAIFFEEFKRHIFEGLPRMKKEIILFLIAGFFSGAFIYADLGESFMSLIQNTFGTFYIGTAYFIAAIIFFAALIGVHPIVVITVFVTSINPELIGLSPEYFALLLLVSFGVSNTISPSTAVNNLLVNLLHVNLIDVSLRWNLKFAMIMIVIIPIYLGLTGA